MIDWILLLAVWAFGWGCGALCWYWTLKPKCRDDQANQRDDKRQQPFPFA
jgi:hypothetical protein